MVKGAMYNENQQHSVPFIQVHHLNNLSHTNAYMMVNTPVTPLTPGTYFDPSQTVAVVFSLIVIVFLPRSGIIYE